MYVFERRHWLTYSAHVLICIAILSFICTIPLLLFSQQRTIMSTRPTLILFLIGIAMMFGSMLLELAEISLSMRSLRADILDIEAANASRATPLTTHPSDGG